MSFLIFATTCVQLQTCVKEMASFSFYLDFMSMKVLSGLQLSMPLFQSAGMQERQLKLCIYFFCIQDKWICILHHVANEHEWIVEEGGNKAKCDHDPIPDEEQREKLWLKKGSTPHKALAKIVMDKRFLNTFRYYTHFRYLCIYNVFM